MTSNAKGTGIRVLVLYTELAPYVLAGLECLVRDHGAVVDLVRWPVNAEAPFQLEPVAGMIMHERRLLTDADLIALADRTGPDITLCAGWIDKGYLRVCRHLRNQGRRTVMCSDTAWRGDLRQRFAALAGRILFRRVFSHAWVTGRGQRDYAIRLGFRPERVHTGFYAADTRHFLPMGERLLHARTARWPHRFLCVARYIPAKNHQLLCDAFVSLVNDGEAGDWELWSAGTGELFDRVRNSPTGRHERIRHVGFVQAPAMEPLLEQCGVFVLASNYEPWGVAVQEHACAGFPLVLSDRVMAAERFLTPGVNGAIFKADDSEALKNALREIVRKNDDELRTMGRHSMDLGRAWGPAEWARECIGIANDTP